MSGADFNVDEMLYSEDIEEIYAELAKEQARIVKECRRVNRRVLRAIERVLGTKFRRAVVREMKDAEAIHVPIELVREPVGNRVKCDFAPIETIWVDQYETGYYCSDSYYGSICIQLKPNLYLKFHYAC